eukprot:scaffold9726_cov119-Isochrysis_galbana.AAC.11
MAACGAELCGWPTSRCRMVRPARASWSARCTTSMTLNERIALRREGFSSLPDIASGRPPAGSTSPTWARSNCEQHEV